MHDDSIPEEAESDYDDERTRREESSILHLRDEAYQVRDCFTRHSFQALAASCGLIILILKFQADDPRFGFAAVFPIIILFMIADMGLHKYATSNRLLGYELYLYRMRHYTTLERFHPSMYLVGWEEAMWAWRAVNASLFPSIYRRALRACPGGFIALRRVSDNPSWFEQQSPSSKNKNVTYKSGAYLKSLMNAFFVVVGLAAADIAFCAEYICRAAVWYVIVLTVLLTAIIIAICVGRIFHVYSRVKILEDELQSIPSCSMIWEAATLAHFKTLDELGLLSRVRIRPGTLNRYSEVLEKHTADIVRCGDNLPNWLLESRAKLYDVMASRAVANAPAGNAAT